MATSAQIYKGPQYFHQTQLMNEAKRQKDLVSPEIKLNVNEDARDFLLKTQDSHIPKRFQEPGMQRREKQKRVSDKYWFFFKLFLCQLSPHHQNPSIHLSSQNPTFRSYLSSVEKWKIQPKTQHPMFTTTASSYGKMTPTIHEMPKRFHGQSSKFTEVKEIIMTTFKRRF